MKGTEKRIPATMTISVAEILVAIATPHAQRLRRDFPEGDRDGQAMSALNVGLEALGLDWEAVERTSRYYALARTVAGEVRSLERASALSEERREYLATGGDL